MIRSARLSKILGDLRTSPGRTIVVVLSITVGVTAVGMVVGARSLMLRALDDSRREGSFPSATLIVDGVIPPGLGETRRVVHARVGSRDLILSSLPGRLARVTPERGAWPPPLGTIAVERSSHLSGLVPIRLPSGAVRTVRVSGVVHDVNVPPTRTYGILSAYATKATLARLGIDPRPNELLLAAGGERAAAHARRLLAARGVAVQQTIVPKPGAFWAEDPVRAMVLLLTVLAVVCLFMSAFLVVNIVSALVTQQTPQIGVMKAVGARSTATAALYLATAGLYGLFALVLAIPLAAVAALALVSYSAGLINLNVPSFSLPPSVLAVEIVAAIVLPLLAALTPVAIASRITVRDAISRRGTGGGRLFGGARALSVAIRLALANTLRRRRRLLLTTLTLALAGAVFVGVLSVRTSLYRTLDEGALYRHYDLAVDLDAPYPAAALERVARGVPGVVRTEAWSVDGAFRVRPDGSESQTFSVVGAPPGSSLLQPLIVRGRGLRPGDRRAIVVNTDVLDSEHGLGPGDVIRLAVAGAPPEPWHVVGVAQRIVAGPVVYTTTTRPQARRLVVVTDGSDVSALLTKRLARAGFGVDSARTSAELAHYDHANFSTIVSFLLAMAVVLAVVGGLGLAGMLSINVLERSREIGVLRAIGARDGDVLQLVIVEGLFVAALGCLIAAPAGWLVGRGLSDAVGRLFLGAPLQFAYPGSALLIWLGLTAVLAVAASWIPARRAARLTIRDVLAYE